MNLKVSIADDHSIVTSGIEKLLKDHPPIELDGIYHDGVALLKGLETLKPDVLLLDIQMPGMQGNELAQLITRKDPEIAILVLTNMDMPFHVRNMFASGVKGYLLKSATKNILVEAIETVSRGQQYIDSSLKEQLAFELVAQRRKGLVPALTRRELKILEMIAEEKTNPQIAGELFISISTVENHRTNLFFKLGVKNAAGLVRKGIQMGLIR